MDALASQDAEFLVQLDGAGIHGVGFQTNTLGVGVEELEDGQCAFKGISKVIDLALKVLNQLSELVVESCELATGLALGADCGK